MASKNETTLPSHADIDALRARLVQLIDSLALLQTQLYQASASCPVPTTANPGVLPYKDLLARYNLILSHYVGLNAVLSSVNDAERRGLRDPKKDKWQSAVVLPRVPIEESKDWLAGVLLRTKQMPDIEEYQEQLLKGIPDSLRTDEAVKQHTTMLERSAFVINEMKDSLHGQEWEWKARVRSEDEQDQLEQQKPSSTEKSPWSLKDVLAYQRTGKIPDSVPKQ